MLWRSLAELTMVAHYLVLAYIAFGGFLAWQWRAALYPHVLLVGWGVLVTLVPIPCPLTDLEDLLRLQGGEPALTGGFIDTYVKGVLYPEQYNAVVLALGAVLVTLSWIALYRRSRGRPPVERVTHAGHG